MDEVKAAVHGAGGCFPAHRTRRTRRAAASREFCIWRPMTSLAASSIYPSSGGPPVDVAPSLDTLVLFSSTTTLHRTLPLKRGQRPLVSFWFSSPTPLLADRTAEQTGQAAARRGLRPVLPRRVCGGWRVEHAQGPRQSGALNAAAEAALSDDERATSARGGGGWRRRRDLV